VSLFRADAARRRLSVRYCLFSTEGLQHVTKRQIVTLAPASLLLAASTFTKSATAQTIEGELRPSNMPPEFMTRMNAVFDGFNRRDFGLFKSAYGGDVVIVNGFFPFRWTGENAVTQYWADIYKFGEKFQVEKEVFDYKGVLAWEVDGVRRYASASAILTISVKGGKSLVRPGIIAFSFAKLDEGWKADEQAWGRLS
jgi:hypothetical protein